MKTQRLAGFASLFGLFVAFVAGCGVEVAGGGSGGGGAGGGGAGGGQQWYTSCGDPVCMEPDGGAMPPAGVATCTTEKEGDACAAEGAKCWPQGSTCGVVLVCAKSDPKNNPGGCPISRVSHKKDIGYLTPGEVESLAEEAKTMRLSSWRYKDEDAKTRPHVGFLIDDMPESVAVDRSGERVDLYGYTSMAIAATQVQDKRLEAMEREISAMREEMKVLRDKANRCDPR